MDNAESEPPRCPCGFWGSPQTMNLCSKCYKDELRRRQRDEKVTASNGVSSSTLSVPRAVPASNAETSKMESCTTTSCTITKADVSNQISGVSPVAITENEENSRDAKCSDETDGASTSKPLPDDRPMQKNKKRCWCCKAKLELAQRELGQCKCEYVFCQLHRLPEQHDCIYDHKESGRRQARQKMVTLGPRKVGRSFQRLDE